MQNPSTIRMESRRVKKGTDIHFRVASGSDTDAAVEARAEIFLRDFGQIGDDGKDAAGHHLVAVTGAGDVVAGFRLLGPELRPFPFEHAFDLSPMVQKGGRPALLGRLFVRHDFRAVAQSAPLLQGLLRLAINFARANDITDFYISAFNNLIRFYSHAGFRSLGIAVHDQHWRTLHLMHMNIAQVVAGQNAKSTT